MLASIKDLRNPTVDKVIPEEMLALFNSKLPDKYAYQPDGTDNTLCYLSPNEAPMAIDGANPMLTREQSAMLDGRNLDDSTIDLLVNNALERVQYDITNATVKLDGGEIPAGELAKTAKDNQFALKGRFYRMRDPVEFDLNFTCKESVRRLRCRQVPSHSIDCRAFETIGSALLLHIEVTPATKSIRCSVNFVPARECTLIDCYRAAVVQDGLFTGETTISEIGSIQFDNSSDSFSPLAPFWKKAIELERAIGFTIPVKANVDGVTKININRLFESICQGKALPLGFKPESITMEPIGQPPEYPNEPIRLVIPHKSKLKLFLKEYEFMSSIGLDRILIGTPEIVETGKYSYPIEYTEGSKCSIIYHAGSDTNDSPDYVQELSTALFDDRAL